MAKLKKHLIAEAQQKGVEVDKKMTVAEIEALIDKAGHEPTPATQSAEARSADSGEEFLKRYVLASGAPGEETVQACVAHAVGQAKQQGVILTDPKGAAKKVGDVYEVHVTGKAVRG